MSEPANSNVSPVDVTTPEGQELREIKARRIIRTYATAALLVGIIPLPLIDVFFIVAIQVRMIQKLTAHYGYQFDREQQVYSALGSLFGGMALPLLILPVLISLVKFIPVLGTFPAMVSMPVLVGATTYAVGRTFVQHFEAGGSLLSFNPVKMRSVLRAYYEEGRKEGLNGKSASVQSTPMV